MKSSDVPHLRGEEPVKTRAETRADAREAVAEAKAEAKEAAAAEAKEAELAPASESGDAAVQHLLALRETYANVGDETGLAGVNDKLAKLGYR